MDLGLFSRVIWRFRVIVAAGLVLALALTFLSLVRVDLKSGGLSYRAKKQWASYARIFVTQRGFPYGSVRPAERDPATLASNAIFYANLANADAVKRLAFGRKDPGGTIEAAALTTSPTTSDTLPIISIAGLADSATKAMYLARAETRALIAYVTKRQAESAISSANRVQLQVIDAPDTAKLVHGRSQTVPIVVFLTVMAAVIGFVFVLENLRPRVRAIQRTAPVADATRQSA